MNPPFTAQQFFESLAAYNESVWPLQLVWVVLALLIVGLSVGSKIWFDRLIGVILSVMWVWMAIVYHWLFFLPINDAALVFGAAFMLEGLLLLFYGLKRRPLRFAADLDVYGIIGLVLVVYALVLYPLLGVAFGHRYPAQPTFGLPCPTTIFTIGILLWVRPKIPWSVLVIPVLWSLIGLGAAWSFGVMEDVMLPVGVVTGVVFVVMKNRAAHVTAGATT
jgi:hypothetical protein